MKSRSFKLMNYSTEVPASRTIMEIEELLARAGVKSVHKEYAASEPIGFVFSIQTRHGELFFKMPCEVEPVFETLYAEIRKPHHNTKQLLREQAVRVAWRVMLDSLRADLTKLRLKQVVPEQVFLPYLYNPRTGTTLYQQLETTGFKMLGEGKSAPVV